MLSALTFLAVWGLMAPTSGQRTTPYVNCSAARAAGAAPVHRGAPGYAVHLDRDLDGIGCEGSGADGHGRRRRS